MDVGELIQTQEEERVSSSEIDWSFGGLWPYEPKWFDGSDGRLHYIDEGPRDGRPVVLVCGNPVWSFIWRDAIERLTSAGHRAIAIDHLGFGRSDKADDKELYRVRRHAARFAEFADSLELTRAVIVPHDWGGPISLSWAIANPDRVDALFVLNTFAQRPPRKTPLPLPIRLMRMPLLGELMVKGLGAFHRGFLFRAGVTHPEHFTKAIKAAYLAPHPTWSSRTPVLVFPREIPPGPEGSVADFAAEIDGGLREHFSDKPKKLCWAERDIAFTEDLLNELWLETFPDIEVQRVPDAGHFLQEDQPEVVFGSLVEFVGSLGS